MISFNKYRITAPNVPTWTAISVKIPWSFHSVNSDIKIRWAEELIGKNSVMPWKAASVSICVNCNLLGLSSEAQFFCVEQPLTCYNMFISFYNISLFVVYSFL